MRQDFRNQLPLVIGLAIPILLILFVAGSIYLPQIFAEQPKYDFLYAVGGYPTHVEGSGDDTLVHRYSVQDKKLTRETTPGKSTCPHCDVPRFYVHNVSQNESRDISFEEAQKLALDASRKSPDGFEVIRGESGNGIFPLFFGDSDYNERFVTGKNWSKKLNVEIGEYYLNDFHFIGWIFP